MRIVAGEFGGRNLVAPKGRGVRPTLEKVREAVFDSIGPRIREARVLDLFAGSGAYGLESLSRGAAHATFVDISPRSLESVRENLAKLGIPAARWTVMTAEAAEVVARFAKAGTAFDFVFVDPPYEGDFYEESLLGLSVGKVVVPGGTVVAEHSKRVSLSVVYGELRLDKERRYGETCIGYYRRAVGVVEAREETP